MGSEPSASVSVMATAETVQDFVERLKKKGMTALVDEFNVIKSEKLAGTTTEYEKSTEKNRYGNIPLLDETRVVLNDGLSGNYIHASWVDGFNKPKAYIICQAPVPGSIIDYWRMVWQERISLIVCLTSMKERGAAKADTFFPMDVVRPFRAGPFRLIPELITPIQGHPRVVALHLRFKVWYAKKNTVDRMVVLILYGNWPDTAVPQDTPQFLKFVKMIKQFEGWCAERAAPGPRPPPTLIHCSAGVGRSATLVASRIAYDQLTQADQVDIQGVVRKMRRQRAMAVQNVLQYIFLNLLVLEAARRRRSAAGKVNVASKGSHLEYLVA